MHKHTREQQECLHTYIHSNREGWDTRRQWLWLMHQARGPAVVGVCVLITLSVCFISSWWSLMNELALGILASLVVLSPNREHFRGADRCPPPLHLNHLNHLPPLQRALPQIGRCVCIRLLKIWWSWTQPAPEFINLHLKDNSGTSRQPYAPWLLESFPPLGFSARRWALH